MERERKKKYYKGSGIVEWGSRDNPSVDLTPGLSPTLKPHLKGLGIDEIGY